MANVFTASKTLVTLPPAVLGFNALITPNTKFGEPGFYSVNAHFVADGAREAAIARLQKEVDRLWPDHLKELGEPPQKKKGVPGDPWEKPDVEAWWEKNEREGVAFKNKDIPNTPFTEFKLPAKEGVSKKTGEPFRITPRAWDAEGKLLDLETLYIAAGTVFLPVLNVQLSKTPMTGNKPALSAKMAGIRILQLKQFKKAGMGDVSDEDLAFLGTDFDAEDLSAYVKPAKAGKAGKVGAEGEAEGGEPPTAAAAAPGGATKKPRGKKDDLPF